MTVAPPHHLAESFDAVEPLAITESPRASSKYAIEALGNILPADHGRSGNVQS